VSSKDDRLMVSYLLGELEEPERQQFEERYFTDDLLFQELQSVKQDLINDYLKDRLTPKQKAYFDQHYARNRLGREQIRFIRHFHTALHTQRLALRQGRRQGLFLRYLIPVGMAAALVVTTALTISTYFENRRLQEQLETYKSAPANPASASVSGPAVERLQLNASDLRVTAGGGAPGSQVFRIRKDAASVEFRLAFSSADAGQTYTAVLVDVDGVERVSAPQLSKPTITDGTTTVTVVFPAVYLPQGSYVIRLKHTGGDIAESFAFSIRVE
jgi:hypothetical protein